MVQVVSQKSQKNNMSFEKGLAELERIVKKLESEDIDLETSIADFEQGIKVQQYCKRKLDEATLQVNYLLKDQDLKPLHSPQYSKLPQQSLPQDDSLDLSDLE